MKITSQNILIPSFDNERKLAQKELKSECVCPNNCYSQFPEDEVYSIQLQNGWARSTRISCTYVHIQHQTFVKLETLNSQSCLCT